MGVKAVEFNQAKMADKSKTLSKRQSPRQAKVRQGINKIVKLEAKEAEATKSVQSHCQTVTKHLLC